MEEKKIISFLRKRNSTLKKDSKNTISIFDGGEDGSTRIIILNAMLTETEKNILQEELRLSQQFVLFFPYPDLLQLVKQSVFISIKKLMMLENETRDENEKYLLFTRETLLTNSDDVDEIMEIKLYRLSDINAKEFAMIKDSVAGFWKIGHFQRILMNSYVLQSLLENGALVTSDYSKELTRVTGFPKGDLHAYVNILFSNNLTDQTGKLRLDNGAFELISEMIQEEYDLNQIIPGSGKKLTGLDYLRFAHIANKKKDFLNLTIDIFKSFLPEKQINYEILTYSEHAFSISYENKWRLVIFCDAHQRSVNETEVGEAAITALRDIKTANTSVLSYNLIVGPSFSSIAIASAKQSGIYICDPFSILEMRSHFSKISKDLKNNLPVKFNLIFPKDGGFISVRENISNVIESL